LLFPFFHKVTPREKTALERWIFSALQFTNHHIKSWRHRVLLDQPNDQRFLRKDIDMIRTEQGWIAAYQAQGGLWIHDNNNMRPHALLAGGEHSGGFFNSRTIIAVDQLMRDAASDLVDLFVANSGDIAVVDRVVGPQTGATKLAEFIAEEIEHRRTLSCFWSSPAKSGEGDGKRMIFDNPDSTARQGECILLCEDVRTTGGSINLTANACIKRGGIIMPFVLMLVDRSGLPPTDNPKVIALITRAMPKWKPAECPYCRLPFESKAVRPKDNWDLLTTTYE
jgi:orotate phosphoribosyltransferase